MITGGGGLKETISSHTHWQSNWFTHEETPFSASLFTQNECVFVCVLLVLRVCVCVCVCVCVTILFIYTGTSCKWHKTTASDHNHIKYIHFVIQSYESNRDTENFWNLSWSSWLCTAVKRLWCWVWTPGRIAMALPKLMEIQIKSNQIIIISLSRADATADRTISLTSSGCVVDVQIMA